MPRNMENEPSVTISGGMFSRAISTAFSAPPAQPSSSANSAAAGMGRCQSRQAAPKTDRRQPHHRAHRKIDSAGDDDGRQRQRQQSQFDAEANHFEEIADGEKFLAMAAKTAISSSQREQQNPLAIREPALPHAFYAP